MIPRYPVHDFARVTLEAETPHAIGSGAGDATHDLVLMRDANHLPTLPASGLAGVLRHACAKEYDEATANHLFGCLEGDGHISRVQVFWGLVHDSFNRPMEGVREDVDSDELLSRLCLPHPLIRQRVRLNHRGAAEERGKFDVTLAPRGTRYTFLLGHWSDGSDAAFEEWQQLLHLLQSPALRLGRGTRSGSGAFRVVELDAARWDLRTPEGREGFCRRPRQRSSRKGLQPLKLGRAELRMPGVELQLRAEAGWRIGAGEHPLGSYTGLKEPDNMLPQSEPVIEWSDGRGTWSSPRPVVPASAIKGALAHRVAFHHRRLTGDFIAIDGPPPDPERSEAVRCLFGHASDHDASGLAGSVIIDDTYLEPEQVIHAPMHNRIDRFTGGVMRGALFQEEQLWRSRLTLRLHILPHGHIPIPVEVRQALNLALRDLARGWLPLGAGGSRGLGGLIADQDPVWNDNGVWVAGQDAPMLNTEGDTA
ncbi:hypothetical protein CKO35_07735 [Ectothiorhodospira shaposhnikovii]|uniref:RAMP superfamily CRISPR-associated protein n=1 Tax=Ectothiorhodospira shaposhnikovii TaxID=1054 RepID=UPI001902CF2F|nr:RAMP superfamily CRISPR-associated protein [Ectothiorhodospira shaposhnikovii]MBK1673199.1 hypothetical protein [Ectothiorhodospira shaposhnikovii]